MSLPPLQTVEQPQACSISWRAAWQLRRKAQPPACASSCWRHSLCTGVPAADTSTHLEPACKLARSVGELHGGSVAKANHLLQVPDHDGSKHSAPECRRQRQARTLSPPPLQTVEQPQACSISRRAAWQLRLKAQPRAGASCFVVLVASIHASILHRSASGRHEHAS